MPSRNMLTMACMSTNSQMSEKNFFTGQKKGERYFSTKHKYRTQVSMSNFIVLNLCILDFGDFQCPKYQIFVTEGINFKGENFTFATTKKCFIVCSNAYYILVRILEHMHKLSSVFIDMASLVSSGMLMDEHKEQHMRHHSLHFQKKSANLVCLKHLILHDKWLDLVDPLEKTCCLLARIYIFGIVSSHSYVWVTQLSNVGIAWTNLMDMTLHHDNEATDHITSEEQYSGT
ncbi:hypothetical protein ACJX0J_023978, partial [Zea mays]